MSDDATIHFSSSSTHQSDQSPKLEATMAGQKQTLSSSDVVPETSFSYDSLDDEIAFLLAQNAALNNSTPKRRNGSRRKQSGLTYHASLISELVEDQFISLTVYLATGYTMTHCILSKLQTEFT